MDQQVIDHLREGVALDLYQTIKAARKIRDQKVFRHTLYDENGMSVFIGLFPKADMEQFPGLDEAFQSRLKVFNAIGVVTDGETRLDMYALAGMNKPFTTLKDYKELMKLLDDGPLSGFLEQYFDVRGVKLDFMNMSYEEFLKAVETEVYANTPMAELSKMEQFLKN